MESSYFYTREDVDVKHSINLEDLNHKSDILKYI